MDKDRSENTAIANIKAIIKNISPILFRNKALKLALFAAIRVYQKFTKR